MSAQTIQGSALLDVLIIKLVHLFARRAELTGLQLHRLFGGAQCLLECRSLFARGLVLLAELLCLFLGGFQLITLRSRWAGTVFDALGQQINFDLGSLPFVGQRLGGGFAGAILGIG